MSCNVVYISYNYVRTLDVRSCYQIQEMASSMKLGNSLSLTIHHVYNAVKNNFCQFNY